MGVLVVGIGMQGRAVVHELLAAGVDPVVAADLDAAQVARTLSALGCDAARAVTLDARDLQATRACIRANGARLVVGMGPPALQEVTARAAIAEGAHFVNTCYADRLGSLSAEARERGLILQPEMGLDPGIDLLLGRLACEELDEVEGLLSYGAGLPVAERAEPPFRYRVSWSFAGVLGAYRRPARYLRSGREVAVPALGVFDAAHVHSVTVPGAGTLEAYPNGDALAYARSFGLGPGLTHMARYTMRWPGHCALWRTLASAGLLDETVADLGDGVHMAPVDFLARWLGPRLRLAPGEPDLVVLRAHAWGRRGGEPHAVAWDLVDTRDPLTGLLAMSRTVGFTAAIAARLILEGVIQGAGLLDPARDVDPAPVLAALEARGVRVQRRDMMPGVPEGLGS